MSSLLKQYDVTGPTRSITQADLTSLEPETLEIPVKAPFGLELNEHHRVTGMTEGGAGAMAGVRKLDRIVAIDDEELAPGGLETALEGKASVLLQLERPPKSSYRAIIVHELVEGSTPYSFAGKGDYLQMAMGENATDEQAHEAELYAEARLGLVADVILSFPLGITEEEEKQQREDNMGCIDWMKFRLMGGGSGTDEAGGERLEAGNDQRAHDKAEEAEKLKRERTDVLLALKRVGLRVVKHRTRDNKKMLLKITAPLALLEEEAERTKIEMRLKAEFNDPDRPDVSTYADYEIVRKHEFALKGGRLFASLERQRLVYSKMEAALDQGGAELDIDRLIAEKAFANCFPLHSAERDELLTEWCSVLGFRIWPCTKDGKRRRLWPDLGLMQQPIEDVRDYFGEKIAFYFAWLEHYTQMLLWLMWASIIMEIIAATDQTAAAVTVPLYCLLVAVWTTMMAELWKRKNSELAYRWDVTDYEQDEPPRPEYLHSFHEGPWANHKRGGNGVMQKKHGFFGKGNVFIENADAPLEVVMDWWAKLRSPTLLVGFPMLALAFVLMLVVTLSILTFRMLMQFGKDFSDNDVANPSTAAVIGGTLNAVWITLMNFLYRELAVYLTRFENHRTETEYEDALIVKTFLFQFFNSYSALFYIAFFKAQHHTFFGAFGHRDDATGKAYADACGVEGGGQADFLRAAANVVPGCDPGADGGSTCRYVFVRKDCMDDLYWQMFTYTLIKPAYELLFFQFLLPFGTREWKQFRLRKAVSLLLVEVGETVDKVADAAEHAAHDLGQALGLEEASAKAQRKSSQHRSDYERALDSFHETIELQREMGTFAGTLAEYNTKIIQYGYVAMFSAACPVSALFAALTNFIELRLDARKISFELRRPRYAGAQDIGTWQYVLAVLSWVAIAVNVMLICFTSDQLRERILIPALAEHASCSNFTQESYEASDQFGSGEAYTLAGLTSHHSRYCADHGCEDRASGMVKSFVDSCVESYNDCYAEIGGVEWLPGTWYLPADAAISTSYVHEGLCNAASPLYNKLHCEVCEVRRHEVMKLALSVLVVMEHVLVLVKVFLALAVPDRPSWVTRAEARAHFLNKQAKQRLRSLEPGPSAEERERAETIHSEAMSLLDAPDDTAGNGGELAMLRSLSLSRSMSKRASMSKKASGGGVATATAVITAGGDGDWPPGAPAPSAAPPPGPARKGGSDLARSSSMVVGAAMSDNV